MSFKGFNSILFDFYSLIDVKLSSIKYIIGENKINDIDFVDSRTFLNCSDNELIKRRYTARAFLANNKNDDEFFKFFKENKSIILKKYAFTTSIFLLANAYKKAGNGIIQTSVHCEDDDEANYIRSELPLMDTIEIGDRKSIDLSKYGRLIIGDYKNALEFEPNEPKSMLIADFNENFNTKDSTQLKSELIIKFGDIHDIAIISAYRHEELNKQQ